jgi:antiviral helicase SKI2
MPEFQSRITLLIALGYVADNRTVLLKGRVAREINSCESLILTELIFNNELTDLEPAEICAVLSTMLFDEDAKFPPLTGTLARMQSTLRDTAVRLEQMQTQCGVRSSAFDFTAVLNFSLMEVVHEWVCGMPFSDLCRLTPVLEGSIVRCITRIAEACKELINAAKIIGESTLQKKAETAASLLKRDVVFATSLYLSS